MRPVDDLILGGLGSNNRQRGSKIRFASANTILGYLILDTLIFCIAQIYINAFIISNWIEQSFQRMCDASRMSRTLCEIY